MAGRQRNDDDAPTSRSYLARANDGLGRIVAALDDDVGFDPTNQLERRVLVEDGDGIDGLEGGEDVRSFTLRPHGPLGSLETFDRGVAVDADNQRVATRTRAHEDVDVSGMQEIEDTIGEHDLTRLPRTPRRERLPRHDFSTRVERVQYVHSAWGEKRMSRTISGISTRS